MPAVPARVYPRARRAANHPGATRGRASGIGRRASGVGRAPAGARPRDKISFHSTTRGPSGTRPLKRPPDSTTDTLLDAGAGYARAHGEKYGWSLEMGQHQA
ncbi:hypothetical protein DPQ99_17895 [Burkholderia pseudomallei]|uniref:hypothetical protein n=1 Tax=Burkholderia pseudomallei TaxID=28450 RepID=UPI0009B1ED15|nr:hypothetical protein [Burkholderia pseudomallei]RAP96393.1 hypothetical protein DPQ99_17895 [Burkholderia pseudomallei]